MMMQKMLSMNLKSNLPIRVECPKQISENFSESNRDLSSLGSIIKRKTIPRKKTGNWKLEIKI